MSNQAYLKQGTLEVRHNGEKHQFVIFQDNYGSEYIGLTLYEDHFYDDDLELLNFVMGLCQSEDRDNARAILDSIEENECGMFINGEYYEWEKIESLFKDYRLDFSQN